MDLDAYRPTKHGVIKVEMQEGVILRTPPVSR